MTLRHTHNLPTGSDVFDDRDPRHIGRLDAVHRWQGRITWHETRHVSWIDMDHVKRATEDML